MKQKLKLKETYFSHNGTLYKGDKVLTTDPMWMTKDIVKVTDLSGRIYRLESKLLTDSH
tara:strand:- start:190 stop:366 length:177 start_codon:yes stop_codon:yes gene_type:complete